MLAFCSTFPLWNANCFLNDTGFLQLESEASEIVYTVNLEGFKM